MDTGSTRNSIYLTVLVCAACLILLGGWFARPRSIPRDPAPVPSETELEQLARRAQRRSLESMTKYFAAVAVDVSASLASVRGGDATAVVWDRRRVLAPSVPAIAGDTIGLALSGVQMETTRDLWGQNLPLIVLTAPEHAAAWPVPRRAATLPGAGDWVLAVWRSVDAPVFSAATFRQPVTTSCGRLRLREFASSLATTREMAGGGLFNLDGELLGLLLPCGDHLAAIDVSSVDTLLQQADTIGQRLQARCGLMIGAVSDLEKSALSSDAGLMVREVWNDSAADAAGIRPGDVIQRLGERSVSAIDDLRELTVSHSAPVPLAVRRGGRTLTLYLAQGAGPTGSDGADAGAGLYLESTSTTFRIASVAAGSRGARAGLEPGDRLLRIDQAEPRNAQQIRRLLSAARVESMLLEVERGGRRIAIVLPHEAATRE